MFYPIFKVTSQNAFN